MSRLSEIKEKYQKLHSQENTVHELLEVMECMVQEHSISAALSSTPRDSDALERASGHQDAPQMSPSRRHVRKSSEVRRPLPTNGNPFSEKKFLSREVRYGYKGTIIRTRQYASGPACQNLGNVFLASVLGHTTDLDIENCCFTLLLQLLDFMKPELPQWAEVRATLVQCSQERDRVIREELGCQKSEGKGILMKVMNGGQPPAQLQKNQFIKKLQQASIFCRWVACSALPEIYQEMQEDADREQPEASTLFFMWTVVEDLVLSAWIEHVRELQPEHIRKNIFTRKPSSVSRFVQSNMATFFNSWPNGRILHPRTAQQTFYVMATAFWHRFITSDSRHKHRSCWEMWSPKRIHISDSDSFVLTDR